MKLGTLGCSHSSDILGDSWPVFLAEKLNYELCQYHSSGAGNEGITVEKLVHMLENDAPDLIVISLTEISRLVMSVGNSLNPNPRETFNNETYYTFNLYNNVGYLKKHCIEWKNDPEIFRMMITDYNSELKIFHTISIFENLSKIYNTPIYYFSWFNDIDNLLLKHHQWKRSFPNEKFIFSNAQEYMHINFNQHTAECGHFYPKAHKELAEKLYENLIKVMS